MSTLKKNSKLGYDIIKAVIAGLVCFVIHELAKL